MNTPFYIGIFAHNESTTIEGCLKTLRRQRIFDQPHPPTVLVLENGSSDETARIAQETLETYFKGIPTSVHCIEMGDKGNAWNLFTHELSDPACRYLIYMDADIEPCSDDTLDQLSQTLSANPAVDIAVSQPLKDIIKKNQPTRKEQLSLSASSAGNAGPQRLCGQLYAGRAEILRTIHLPLGLLVEDGFLRAVLLTRFFSQPEQTERIIAAEGAAHYFEAYTGLRAWFRHEKRIIIGTEINIMLFSWINELPKKGAICAEEIIKRNQKTPRWVYEMASEKLQNKTFQLHTSDSIFKQFYSWKELPARSKRRALPGLTARLILNSIAVLFAHRDLKKQKWEW